MYRFLGGHMCSFFLDLYLRVEFLGHVITVVTEELPDWFSILPTMYEVSNFSTSSPTLAIIFLLHYWHCSKV